MSSANSKSAREALHALLRPDEEIIQIVDASPAASKTVLYKSALALTSARVLEVSTPTLAKLGIGQPTASTVSVALDEIAGCEFRQGKLLAKNGTKNLVVVRTVRGDFAWATMNPRLAAAFVEQATAAVDAARRPSAPAVEDAAASTADELLKLASLRDQGVITDAEFQAKKSQLLGLRPGGLIEPAAAPAQAVYEVVLQASGAKKVQVIKVIRAVTGLGLKQAKELVDSAPMPIGTRIGLDAAHALQRELEAAGATVVLNVR